MTRRKRSCRGGSPFLLSIQFFFRSRRTRISDIGLDALLDQQQADRLAGRRATYLPAQELRERFGAKSQDATTVVAYLRDQEVDASLDATGSFVTSTMTPAQVKATLKTTLSEYSVDHLGATFNVVSADSAPILPKQLSGIVTEVPPATRTG